MNLTFDTHVQQDVKSICEKQLYPITNRRKCIKMSSSSFSTAFICRICECKTNQNDLNLNQNTGTMKKLRACANISVIFVLDYYGLVMWRQVIKIHYHFFLLYISIPYRSMSMMIFRNFSVRHAWSTWIMRVNLKSSVNHRTTSSDAALNSE